VQRPINQLTYERRLGVVAAGKVTICGSGMAISWKRYLVAMLQVKVTSF
jgi:hypothetical protein